jgi:hypothetical protein
MPDDAPVNPKRGYQRFEDLDLSGGEERSTWRKTVDEINADSLSEIADASHSAKSELIDVMTQAMEAAWQEAVRHLGGAPIEPLPIWTMLATRIMTAAANGERDPKRLKLIALRAFEG